MARFVLLGAHQIFITSKSRRSYQVEGLDSGIWEMGGELRGRNDRVIVRLGVKISHCLNLN